jgi:hypothetical protein
MRNRLTTPPGRKIIENAPLVWQPHGQEALRRQHGYQALCRKYPVWHDRRRSSSIVRSKWAHGYRSTNCHRPRNRAIPWVCLRADEHFRRSASRDYRAQRDLRRGPIHRSQRSSRAYAGWRRWRGPAQLRPRRRRWWWTASLHPAPRWVSGRRSGRRTRRFWRPRWRRWLRWRVRPRPRPRRPSSRPRVESQAQPRSRSRARAHP